jgi:L,D-peptidoglycan transpeptidase YkuD (ErfK/YbiS/YcfS/YnhG family)
VVVILDYNLHPRIQGRGSAVFFHLIRKGASFTEGCVAVAPSDLRKLLPLLGRKTRMWIGARS